MFSRPTIEVEGWDGKRFLKIQDKVEHMATDLLLDYADQVGSSMAKCFSDFRKDYTNLESLLDISNVIQDLWVVNEALKTRAARLDRPTQEG